MSILFLLPFSPWVYMRIHYRKHLFFLFLLMPLVTRRKQNPIYGRSSSWTGMISIGMRKMLKVKRLAALKAWMSLGLSILPCCSFLPHILVPWFYTVGSCQYCFFSSANSVFKAQFHCICSEALKTRILFGRTNLDITTRCRRQEPWVTSGTHHNHTASSPCPALKSYHNGYNIWLQVFYLTLKYKCPGEE